ncbi:HNH endonuclease [Kerstersia gyiorum]|uniref:Uncharacterized protein n=1 Tax=Kerstersia gyiorum TaxID=206506 RepID=A0A171KSG3_9BURK|nr:HNH endonuclease signature motif containing protein [Kerstersia gyiorum]KKO71830.1 hypothetical protein AAV32_09665 [Kerstersia gyiorum]
MGRLKSLPPRLSRLPSNRQQVSANPESWRNDKRTSTQRGYGYKWQQARAEYLAAHPHCVMCLADLGMTDLQPADVIVRCAQRALPEPVATVVDHIVPHQGDRHLFWRRSNWQALCTRHHNRDKQRIERGG